MTQIPTLIRKRSSKNVLSPLMQMCSQNQFDDILKDILSMHIEDVSDVNRNNQTVLHYASRAGHLELVKILLEKNMDPLQMDNQKNSSIFYAVLNGHMEVFTTLYEALEDDERRLQSLELTNAASAGAYTLLHTAVRWNHSELIQLLLSLGARVDAKDRINKTPLHYARDPDVIHMLNDGLQKQTKADAEALAMKSAQEAAEKKQELKRKRSMRRLAT